MLNPVEFKYADSRWQDLYLFLKGKGFEVYAPEQHLGECLEPYIVVKFDGAVDISGISSFADLYSIMCYVPINQYSKLDSIVMKVREVMKELRPLFIPYNENLSTSFYDEQVKGHYVQIEYKNYKKN